MNILVTGGLGVNGCWVTRQLLEMGHRVIVLDNRADFSLLSDIARDFEFVEADILDFDRIAAALKKGSVEAICHLAAIYPEACDVNPLAGFRINAMSTVQILEAARITGVRRLVFTSSIATLAPILTRSKGEALCVDEDYPACPGDSGVYGATKLASELMGQNYRRLFGLEFAALRYAPIYGPGKLAPRHGDASMFVLPRIIVNALAGIPTKLESPGDQLLDMTYARDVGDSVVRACVAEKLPSSIYHIGAGRTYTMREFCDEVRSVIPGASIELAPDARELAAPTWQFDISRARRELGYEPRFPPALAVRDWLAWNARLGI